MGHRSEGPCELRGEDRRPSQPFLQGFESLGGENRPEETALSVAACTGDLEQPVQHFGHMGVVMCSGGLCGTQFSADWVELSLRQVDVLWRKCGSSQSLTAGSYSHQVYVNRLQQAEWTLRRCLGAPRSLVHMGRVA